MYVILGNRCLYTCRSFSEVIEVMCSVGPRGKGCQCHWTSFSLARQVRAVCLYVRMYVYMYVCMYVLSVCMSVCLSVCMYVCPVWFYVLHVIFSG